MDSNDSNISLCNILLRVLHVPHTRVGIERILASLPFKGTLWAICKLFKIYGISERSFRTENKEDIYNAGIPLVVETNKGFAVITSISEQRTTILFPNGERISMPGKTFLDIWKGAGVQVSATKKSCEPNFSENQYLERKIVLKRVFVLISIIAILCSAIYYSVLQPMGIYIASMVFTSIMGIFVSIMLIKKHLHIKSVIADMLCDTSKTNGCDKVTNSFHSSWLKDNYGLAEAAFSYFLVNIIMLLVSPSLLTEVTLFVLSSFVAVIWSFLFQWIKLKAWCPLCLITDVLLTIQTLICAIYIIETRKVLESAQDVFILFFLLICYLFVFVLVGAYAGILMKNKTIFEENGQLENLKYSTNTWNALLDIQCHYDTAPANPILASKGNDTGLPTITVIGNPYCRPCAEIHRRVSKLREYGFPIMYIFTAFSQSLLSANDRILGACNDKSVDETWGIISQWYESFLSEDISHSSLQNMEKKELLSARKSSIRQMSWVKNNHINGTPTLLVDGRNIPTGYELEDLMLIY